MKPVLSSSLSSSLRPRRKDETESELWIHNPETFRILFLVNNISFLCPISYNRVPIFIVKKVH